MHSKEQSVHKINSAYMEHYEAHQKRQQKRRKQLVRRLIVMSVFVLVIAVAVGSYHIKQRKTFAEKQQEYEQLEAQLAKLKKDEQNYLEEIELLNNDEYVLEIRSEEHTSELQSRGHLVCR